MLLEVRSQDHSPTLGGFAAGRAGLQENWRSSARTTKVLRIARLSDGDAESLGIIRNISDYGMMVEIHQDFALGKCVTVDLGDGVPLLGEVRWREGTSAGLHFAHPLDQARILGKPSSGRTGGRAARLPRVKTAHSAHILLSRGRIKVEVCDISVGGARVRCDDWLEPNEQVSLLIPGLAAIPGAVRWQAEGNAGIAFHQAASIQALMAWLSTSAQDSVTPDQSDMVMPFGEVVTGEPVQCDPLTGLLDRRSFLAQLDAIVAGHAKGARSLVLALIDLDGFKALNDFHGHDTGDAVLVEAARRIAEAGGSRALVARLGSDEFAVLLTKDAQLDRSVSAMGAALAEPILTPSGCHELSASIGLAVYPQDAGDGSQLLRHADIALGVAQQAGVNRIAPFTREMLDCLSRRVILHDKFAAGLRAGEFTVHYEPIVPLASDCGIKMEALFRWNHPEYGLLKAAQFSDIFAEETLSAQIGLFVLGQVIEQIGAWRANGIPINAVTVNATLADFRSPCYVNAILAAIDTGQVTSLDICVEITEDVLLDDAMHCARHEIERLHDAGVCLIFDDFGTGYASLRHLRDMPICGVKIDRSFVARIASEEIDRGLVKSIVDIAHLLGRVVVAEGVETPEQAELLRGMGCDLMQGYLIAQALPAADAAALAAQITDKLAAA